MRHTLQHQRRRTGRRQRRRNAAGQRAVMTGRHGGGADAVIYVPEGTESNADSGHGSASNDDDAKTSAEPIVRRRVVSPMLAARWLRCAIKHCASPAHARRRRRSCVQRTHASSCQRGAAIDRMRRRRAQSGSTVVARQRNLDIMVSMRIGAARKAASTHAKKGVGGGAQGARTCSCDSKRGVCPQATTAHRAVSTALVVGAARLQKRGGGIPDRFRTRIRRRSRGSRRARMPACCSSVLRRIDSPHDTRCHDTRCYA